MLDAPAKPYPFPDTKLYNCAVQEDLLIENPWNAFDPDLGLVWNHENLSHDELWELNKRACRKFDLRPKIVIDRLQTMRSFNDSKMHVDIVYRYVWASARKRK